MSTANCICFRILVLLGMLRMLGACARRQPGAGGPEQPRPPRSRAEAAEAPAATENPYLDSVMRRKGETYDTTPFKKDGPYRIALAAQGPTNSWATLFDEHARDHVAKLGKDVVSELLYADANGSADKQVPQVEDLLSQDPDALDPGADGPRGAVGAGGARHGPGRARHSVRQRR